MFHAVGLVLQITKSTYNPGSILVKLDDRMMSEILLLDKSFQLRMDELTGTFSDPYVIHDPWFSFVHRDLVVLDFPEFAIVLRIHSKNNNIVVRQVRTE
jgi:hypothetical protein